MLYIGSMIALGILVLLAVIVGQGLRSMAMPVVEGDYRGAKKYKEQRENGLVIIIISLVVGVLLFGGFTLGGSIKTVKAGHTGLVYTFDDITGQRSPGINMIWPWQGFKVVNTQVQRIRPETVCEDVNAQGQVVAEIPDCLATFSIETQNVYIVPSINVKLQRGKELEFLFSDVGPDWVDEILRPRLHQAFKDVTRLYMSVDIAPAREEIRAQVVERLNAEMASVPEAGAIFIVDVLIDNISFSQSFETKILQKMEATQEAERQAALVVAAEKEAEQILKLAEGEAAANNVIAASLRESGIRVLQQRAIDAIGPGVRIMLLPIDSGIFPILGEDLLTGGLGPPATVAEGPQEEQE